MRITESTITNEGLDYIRSLDDFYIWGTIECYYPEILNKLRGDYNITTTAYWGTGSVNSGNTITNFRKRNNVKENLIKIQEFIEDFEKRHGSCISYI